jgi:hypothetical protein
MPTTGLLPCRCSYRALREAVPVTAVGTYPTNIMTRTAALQMIIPMAPLRTVDCHMVSVPLPGLIECREP